MPPTVSFVIPCYNLAHLLPQCVESILSQTFSDFEILIMDDCSPDNAYEVSRQFIDPRIRYIRNQHNLGHLRNYNKGVETSLGKYIWLISADDRLRCNYVLQRYVALLNINEQVGYVFCSGIGLKNNTETKVLDNFAYGSQDNIFNGRQFISTVLAKGGGLLSPSVMARKACYEDLGMFPLDMPHQGDLYLWFLWALEYDVGYMAEPMVNYRFHELNIGTQLLKQTPKSVFSDEIEVLWRTKQKAEQRRVTELVEKLQVFIGWKYGQAAAFAPYSDEYAPWRMSVAQCEAAICDRASSAFDCATIMEKFRSVLGNTCRLSIAGEHVQRAVLARRYLWCITNMISHSDYSAALTLAIERCRASDCKYAERWVVGDLRVRAAQLFWYQRKVAKAALFICHAVIARPRIAARPIRHILAYCRRRRGMWRSGTIGRLIKHVRTGP